MILTFNIYDFMVFYRHIFIQASCRQLKAFWNEKPRNCISTDFEREMYIIIIGEFVLSLKQINIRSMLNMLVNIQEDRSGQEFD